MGSFLIIYFPLLILVTSIIGLSWSVYTKRWVYIAPFATLLTGVGVHLYALEFVGKWKGMAISLYFGGAWF